MYADHSPVIAAFMRESAANFSRGVLFALCSIRQKITGVPEQLDEIEQYGITAPGLWGWKRDAYFYLTQNAEAIYHEFYAAPDAEAAITGLCAIPGLGIVKAAFVAQLAGLDVACLDSRNVAREGRNPRAYRTDGKRPAQYRAKIARYVAETAGRAQAYWDAWCEDVAEAYGYTAEEISALHLAICKRRQFDLAETF